MISTDDGMIIEFNPAQLNADCAIRINLESCSNIIDPSDEQEEKQYMPRI
jgi:hypothetical protein